MPELTEGQLDRYERDPDYFHGRRPVYPVAGADPIMGAGAPHTGVLDLVDPWGGPLPDPAEPWMGVEPTFSNVPTAPASPTYPSSGGGGGGGGVTPLAFATPAFGGPSRPNYNFEPTPVFTPPEFSAPSAEDALNEPGYQFRLDQGRKALEQSAAGRGTLRTGGTLKDVLGYGQQFASQEYGNVFDRALQSYDRKYTGARDAFAPELMGWQTRTQGMMRAEDLAFQRAWDEYTFGLNYDLAIQQMLVEAGLA